MMGCSLLVIPTTVVFMIGFGIGYAAFRNSGRRVAYSVVSGFTALVVTFGILFAGCLVLLSGANIH